MIVYFILIVGLVGAAALDIPLNATRNCSKKLPRSGLSPSYAENIAHAVHCMNVHGLKMFNRKATVKNIVPTIKLSPDPKIPAKVKSFSSLHVLVAKALKVMLIHAV